MKKIPLSLSIGNHVMIQHPAHLQGSLKLEDNIRLIPTVNISLKKVEKLDEQFVHFDDGSKIERYRVIKIFIEKDVFESEESAPLRIIEEDTENLKL